MNVFISLACVFAPIASYAIYYTPPLQLVDDQQSNPIDQAILKRDYDTAEKLIEQNLQKDPENIQLINQLGFIKIWKKSYDEALDCFESALCLDETSADAIFGLDELTRIYVNQPKYKKKLLQTYEILLTYQPDNPDYLFFAARLNDQLGHTAKAEKQLKKCIQLAPQYLDADYLLASIYMRQNRYRAALEIYSKYPTDPFALEKQGDIFLNLREYKNAKRAYKQLLEMDLLNPDYERRYAYALEKCHEIKKAKHSLKDFLKRKDSEQIRVQLLDLESRFDPAVFYYSNYTQSKESDPTIKKPVVRDFYFDQTLNLFTPFEDRASLETKGIYYRQRERSIYGYQGSNYNVAVYGAQEKIRANIIEEFSLNLTLRGLFARGVGGNLYPFQNTNRFEPGLTLIFQDQGQNFYLDAHVESFIIKNFAIIKSQLLRRDFYDAGLSYVFPLKFSPELAADFSRIYYHDNIHNREDWQTLFFRLKIPKNFHWMKLVYRFDHSTFTKLTPNYFTYKNQIVNTVGFNAHAFLSSKSYFDLGYEHSWQVTKNLLQPIGNFILIQKRQSLICNKVYGIFHLELFHGWNFDLGGHYYQNNLPYKEYQVKGELVRRF